MIRIEDNGGRLSNSNRGVSPPHLPHCFSLAAVTATKTEVTMQHNNENQCPTRKKKRGRSRHAPMCSATGMRRRQCRGFQGAARATLRGPPRALRSRTEDPELARASNIPSANFNDSYGSLECGKIQHRLPKRNFRTFQLSKRSDQIRERLFDEKAFIYVHIG